MIVTPILLSAMYCAKVFADVSYADLFLAGRGYKPVGDVRAENVTIGSSPKGNMIPDNPGYREWCINTFNNGEQIYEAYREIAFDIDYRAEPPTTDYWQTPEETCRSKRGDCEDSVFLFFSRLSGLSIDGDIVWGWVSDRDTSVVFAHVWYQLFDKRGRAYIVEGFSKEWNGIIPEEMLTDGEERTPTLMIRHNHLNYVANKMIPLIDCGQGDEHTEFFGSEQFSWGICLNNASLIKEIFQKLQDMFTRYTSAL